MKFLGSTMVAVALVLSVSVFGQAAVYLDNDTCRIFVVASDPFWVFTTDYYDDETGRP